MMTEHRARRRLLSTRLRAFLCLGLATGALVTGTFAFWTDDVVVSGTTFTSGVVDLQVNSLDAYSTATLSMSSTLMLPGATSAEILTMKNNGTVPIKYTLVGGLAGTDAALYNSTASLKLTIMTGATRTGSGNAATCTAGTIIYGPTALTNVTSTAIIATRRGPLAVAGTEALCFQITFDAAASTTLEGKTATATFTATGTSDIS